MVCLGPCLRDAPSIRDEVENKRLTAKKMFRLKERGLLTGTEPSSVIDEIDLAVEKARDVLNDTVVMETLHNDYGVPTNLSADHLPLFMLSESKPRFQKYESVRVFMAGRLWDGQVFEVNKCLTY